MTVYLGWKNVYRLLALTVLLILGLTGPAQAGGAVNTGGSGDVAIMGYDPVAYFTESHAVKGSPEFRHEWLGAVWHFASAENRDAFAANPISYAPQYGGLCARSVAHNKITVDIDPTLWRVLDGKLYLFSGRAGLEQDWDAHPVELVAQADANWPGIRSELVAQ
jgi:YHS domain-containing protein